MQENILSCRELCTSCFIEPIKQKLFTFTTNNDQNKKSKTKKLQRSQKIDDKVWMPVMSYKKLYAEPKFIMSLERKKARIISGIRDRQIEDNFRKSGGMIGSKVRNKSYKQHANRLLLNNQSYSQQLVEQHVNKLAKINLKTKKNPYMNFSLMYISERKKLETDLKTKMSTNVCREKGSDSPYIHMIINESNHKKQLIRPHTSYSTSQKSRRNQRPKSQIN